MHCLKVIFFLIVSIGDIFKKEDLKKQIGACQLEKGEEKDVRIRSISIG